MNNPAEFLLIMNSCQKLYDEAMTPLCKKYKITNNAIDIILFLANNPQYSTASEITRIRGIKANIVSFNVEKLVGMGILERVEVKEDRRKVKLICTKKAQPIIDQGHEIQKEFIEKLFQDFNDDDKKAFIHYIEVIINTISQMKEEEK